MRNIYAVFMSCFAAAVIAQDSEPALVEKPDTRIRMYVAGNGEYGVIKYTRTQNSPTRDVGGFSVAGGALIPLGSALDFRIEPEYTFVGREDTQYNTFMLNMGLESNLRSSPVNFYGIVGGGINVLDTPFTYVDSGPAVNFGLGAVVRLSEGWKLDTGVRSTYSWIDYSEFNRETRIQTHLFHLGVRKVF